MKKIILSVLTAFIIIFSFNLSYSTSISADWDWTLDGKLHSVPTDPSEPTLPPSYPGDTRDDKHTLTDKTDKTPETPTTSPSPSPSPVPSVPSGAAEIESSSHSWIGEPSEKTSTSGFESGFTYGNVDQAANDRIAPIKNLFASLCIVLFPLSLLAILFLCIFAHNEKKFLLYIGIAGTVTLTTFIVILIQNNFIDNFIKAILKSLGF